MSYAWGAFAFAVLVLATAYFVAAEFSFVATGRHRLEERAREGDRRATHALAVQRRLSFMLTAAQLGITVSSLLLGVIVEPTLARALRPLLTSLGISPVAVPGIAVVLALLLATGIMMVFGELAPKNLAIGEPERVALRLARATELGLRVTAPAVALFDNAANRLLRLVGIEPAEELDHAVTAEELEVIIAESGRAGSLTASQTGLLQRVLEFRGLRAVEVQVPRTSVVTITAEATCTELADLACTSGLSRFPVVGDDLDDVRGVVVAKDVLAVPYERRATEPVRALLTPPLAVPESALLSPLLAELREAHSQLALVIDEHGGVTGIVTLEDIVEEIVGEIQSEYDLPDAKLDWVGDRAVDVAGSMSIDDFNESTGAELPQTDARTLAGLVFHSLGRAATKGDTVHLKGVTLRVEEVEGARITRIRGGLAKSS
jgi:CBS domain containing-hemolysin-like protein